jgi:hypothetical protein
MPARRRDARDLVATEDLYVDNPASGTIRQLAYRAGTVLSQDVIRANPSWAGKVRPAEQDRPARAPARDPDTPAPRSRRAAGSDDK